MFLEKNRNKIKQRLLSYHKVSKKNCWIWQKGLYKSGYGKICIANYISNYAHRVSWEMHYGPIPKDLYVIHICDVRPCINPKHLILGPHRLNMIDMAKKYRDRNQFSNKTYCKHGHRFDKKNTYLYKKGKSYGRGCRTCCMLRMRKHRKKSKKH